MRCRRGLLDVVDGRPASRHAGTSGLDQRPDDVGLRVVLTFVDSLVCLGQELTDGPHRGTRIPAGRGAGRSLVPVGTALTCAGKVGRVPETAAAEALWFRRSSWSEEPFV